MSHTPGPWKSGDTAGPNGIQVYRSRSKGFRDHVVIASNVNSDADAHLLSAAPELLEALIHMNQLFVKVDLTDNEARACRMALAAIAKAEGRTA